jgi:NADPH-dependent 2,4-dienoyl-CoA reductase/sulfur reductase-like enzyme
MGRCVPPRIGARIEAWHRAAGVEFRLACRISDVKPEGRCLRIVTDCDEIEVDVLLVAIGAEPNTDLARDAGIAVQDGILTDECGRTSVAGIFAAGEVARVRQPTGAYQRFETWQIAQYQPMAVAHALCGIERPYAELPWHWTNQYTHNVQILGSYREDLDWLEREETEGRLAVLGIDRDDRLHAAILIDNGREVTPLRRLIIANRPVTRQQLTDVSLPLRQL